MAHDPRVRSSATPSAGRPCRIRCAGRCCVTSTSLRTRYLHHDRRGAGGEHPGPPATTCGCWPTPGSSRRLPERAHGRERWWRHLRLPIHREPDYDSLTPGDPGRRWTSGRAQQIPGEPRLWSTASLRGRPAARQVGPRASRPPAATTTVEDLEALLDELHRAAQQARTQRGGRAARGRDRCSCGCSTFPTSPPRTTDHSAARMRCTIAVFVHIQHATCAR